MFQKIISNIKPNIVVLKLFPSVSDLFAKEEVQVHAFTAFIFPSGGNAKKLFQIQVRLNYYFATFYYFDFYHVFTTATHYKVCIMRWQCSGLVFYCTDSIPRDCSHICGEALALCNCAGLCSQSEIFFTSMKIMFAFHVTFNH